MLNAERIKLSAAFAFSVMRYAFSFKHLAFLYSSLHTLMCNG
jgi:hypothetical protein